MQLKITMPAITLLLVIASILENLHAQDIDRKKVDITYIKLPINQLPTEVETYYVNVKSKNSSWGNSLGNVYDAEKIKLNGYYRLPDATDADLVIESEVINDLIFDKAEERRSEQTYKRDRNSPAIKYLAYYYYVTYYTPKVHYRMITKSGKTVADGFIGGNPLAMEFGSMNYSDYFSNSYALSAAWRNEKYNLLAGRERDAYTSSNAMLQGHTLSYCMYPTSVDFSVRYVDEKKGRTVYKDLLDARDFYLEAVSNTGNDKIVMINKLVQPDYQSRKEIMNKAITLWETALAEADFDNKKARIDSRIGRHLYYNLALAYLWIDDFAKAKEYAQGRKKDLGSWDKNLLSGIRDLSTLIDDRATRQEANKWRTLLLNDSNVYVYKNAETRQREKDEAMKIALAKLDKQKADSIAAKKQSKVITSKTKEKTSTAKTTPVSKHANKTPAEKSAALNSNVLK